MARLIISSPDGKKGVLELTKAVTALGRGNANDLVLNDASVSRSIHSHVDGDDVCNSGGVVAARKSRGKRRRYAGSCGRRCDDTDHHTSFSLRRLYVSVAFRQSLKARVYQSLRIRRERPNG